MNFHFEGEAMPLAVRLGGGGGVDPSTPPDHRAH